MFSAYPARSNRAAITKRRVLAVAALPCTAAPRGQGGAYLAQLAEAELSTILENADIALAELQFFGAAL